MCLTTNKGIGMKFILYTLYVLCMIVIIIFFLVVGFANSDSDKFYEPMNDKEFRPLVFVKQCENENRFVLGIDENRNKLIDGCYSIKYIDGELHFKRVKIFYEITDDKVVKKQGCVCD